MLAAGPLGLPPSQPRHRPPRRREGPRRAALLARAPEWPDSGRRCASGTRRSWATSTPAAPAKVAPEPFNGLIELHRCIARGFRKPENYRLRMLLIGGALPPHDRARGQPRPRVSGPARVPAPHPPTGRAPVAAHPDQQRRGPPPERRVRQPTRDAVTHHPLGAAPPAERILLTRRETALQHRRPGRHILAHGHQPKLAQTGERRHVRRAEGNVVHVEVFRDERVGAFLGRPRRPPRERRAHPRYTLIREEPLCCRLQATQRHRIVSRSPSSRCAVSRADDLSVLDASKGWAQRVTACKTDSRETTWPLESSRPPLYGRNSRCRNRHGTLAK